VTSVGPRDTTVFGSTCFVPSRGKSEASKRRSNCGVVPEVPTGSAGRYGVLVRARFIEPYRHKACELHPHLHDGLPPQDVAGGVLIFTQLKVSREGAVIEAQENKMHRCRCILRVA
jgi:hypothetical protein